MCPLWESVVIRQPLNFFCFSFCRQTRSGPISPLSPWSWWTSSTHPKSRGHRQRRASYCSLSQQPRVLRNLLTRCVYRKCVCCGNFFSFPPIHCLCLLFVRQLFSCRNVLCSHIPLFRCVPKYPCWFPPLPSPCGGCVCFSRCLNL